MPHRALGGMGIEVRRELARREVVVFRQPVHHRRRLLAIEVQLGAGAGGEDRRLGHRLAAGQLAQRVEQLFDVEHHALAHRERCGMVIQAKGEKRHLTIGLY